MQVDASGVLEGGVFGRLVHVCIYQVQILCENQELPSVAHTLTHLAVLDSACIENEIPCGPELPPKSPGVDTRRHEKLFVMPL